MAVEGGGRHDMRPDIECSEDQVVYIIPDSLSPFRKMHKRTNVSNRSRSGHTSLRLAAPPPVPRSQASRCTRTHPHAYVNPLSITVRHSHGRPAADPHTTGWRDIWRPEGTLYAVPCRSRLAMTRRELCINA
ncbi:hypothetical protein J6590_022604 [Homalodisca vitripennis]|nr:hypothetical protein J6590_022604 [Homalodisca vitripennis]